MPGTVRCLLLLLPCLACQRYVPADLTPPARGSDLRISLSADAGSNSFERIGSRVSQAEGRLLGATDSTLALSVTDVTRTNGLEDAWSGDTVVFHRFQIVSVERRQISRSRTLLSLGALVVGGIVAHAGLRGGETHVVGQPPPGGGN